MKILAIHRFYWPDTPPYASMLRAITQKWVSDGHEVDVLSSQPSYKNGLEIEKQPSIEVLDGVQVIRLNLPSETDRPIVRIFNALRLGVGVCWQALVKKRYDVIMISTSPPVLGGWFAAIAAKLSGARFIYHCMDIHPEIGRISGEFHNQKVFAFLSRLDKWTCSVAKPVVVLSQDMATSLLLRSAQTPPVTSIINNFSLPSDSSDWTDYPFKWPDEPFILLFAGNIGRFQGLDILIDAMINLSNRKDIRLLMMGEGSEKRRLADKAQKAKANVTFLGHQPVSIAKAAMARASAGFVSLIPDLYKYAYPSKTMTYLEQGCPLLVSVEPESCLAREISGSGAGLVVPNGDASALATAISSLADQPDNMKVMRIKARELSDSIFSNDMILAKWSSLLK